MSASGGVTKTGSNAASENGLGMAGEMAVMEKIGEDSESVETAEGDRFCARGDSSGSVKSCLTNMFVVDCWSFVWYCNSSRR